LIVGIPANVRQDCKPGTLRGAEHCRADADDDDARDSTTEHERMIALFVGSLSSSVLTAWFATIGCDVVLSQTRLIPETAVDVRFETVFPPMPFAPASLPLAEHVQRLYPEAGGTARINRVSIGAGTDAAFAALRTKAPVIEGMGLRNFGAHTNNAEYINISSIEPRLYLLTRLIMDIAAGKAGIAAPAAR
jgi:hypothetical protein